MKTVQEIERAIDKLSPPNKSKSYTSVLTNGIRSVSMHS